MFNPATHWKTLYATDREFYSLCLERAESYYTEEYDDVEDLPAEIEVTFGLRRSLLKLNQIDYEANTLFGWGCCGYLALELHELTKLPLALFTVENNSAYWCGHAAVALPDGNFLDIAGVVTADEVKFRYNLPKSLTPTFPSRSDYCKLMFRSDGTGETNPYGDLPPLERKLLRHFAELVARRGGVAKKAV